MLTRLAALWNRLFASRDWQVYADASLATWRERRWTDAGWEYRDLTLAELNKAEWWWSTR